MIKKFRTRFIAAAMASIFIVLSIILGVVHVINYRKLVEDADRTLQILVENDGKFPEQSKKMGNPKRDETKDEKVEEVPEGAVAVGEKENPKDKMSPELPFESRYFSVLLDKDEKEISIDTGKIQAINKTNALKYAKKVVKKSKKRGFYSIYRYRIQRKGTNTFVIFLDCGKTIGTFSSFFVTSILASVGGILAVLLMVLVLSKQFMKPVVESYEKQKRFITDAGHEIKTPLAVIEADAEVLEMELEDNEWVEDIKKQTAKLKELTNQLIYLSKMEEQNQEMMMIDVPISELVEETSASFQALAITQEKTFLCKIEPLLTCYGNEQSLQHLVEILLDNALKYSTPQGTISLRLKKQGKAVALTVYNTAEHVSKEQVSHIFDRFYRLDESRNSDTGGYGIGLSIASAIVRAHKGKITATTEDEKSLTMTVVI